jgi:molybdate transport system permease protein
LDAWHPLLLSFEVAFIATAIAAVAGVALGALLALRRFPGRELVDVLVTSPLLVPPTVLGYYVLVALGRRSPVGRLYEALTGETIVFTRAGAVVAAALGALPFIAKAARAAIEAVDPALSRAARTLGASPLRAFFTVVLPLARPGMVAGGMLGFARALGDFGVTLMVAGDIPGETQTAALAIYDAIQANREHDAAGMIAVLSVLAIGVLYAANKLSRWRP